MLVLPLPRSSELAPYLPKTLEWQLTNSTHKRTEPSHPAAAVWSGSPTSQISFLIRVPLVADTDTLRAPLKGGRGIPLLSLNPCLESVDQEMQSHPTSANSPFLSLEAVSVTSFWATLTYSKESGGQGRETQQALMLVVKINSWLKSSFTGRLFSTQLQVEEASA